MEFESRLIPILREGVDVIKMVLFKKLQTHLTGKYPDMSRQETKQLAGAIINDLFATPNPEEPFASFVARNLERIASEASSLASTLPELRAPLTDALRVQFLCDSREGIDSTPMLTHARELNVLILDRDVPLPKHFLDMVRTLGKAFHFLEPSHATGDAPGPKVTLH